MSNFKKKDRVEWVDPVSGELRNGILMDWGTITDEATVDESGFVGRFKPVNEKSWDVAEWGTGTPFAIREKDLRHYKKEIKEDE